MYLGDIYFCTVFDGKVDVMQYINTFLCVKILTIQEYENVVELNHFKFDEACMLSIFF